MARFRPGQSVWVNVGGRRLRGKVLRHHETLEAWYVKTTARRAGLAYMESEVSAA